MIQISNISAPAGQTAAKAQSDLAETAKAFEAIFLRQMIGAMRSASLGEGMFDSSATEQFRDMADARTADSLAETGFGIAELLLRQLGARDARADTTGTAA